MTNKTREASSAGNREPHAAGRPGSAAGSPNGVCASGRALRCRRRADAVLTQSRPSLRVQRVRCWGRARCATLCRGHVEGCTHPKG